VHQGAKQRLAPLASSKPPLAALALQRWVSATGQYTVAAVRRMRTSDGAPQLGAQ
jgi:hypothetical protein